MNAKATAKHYAEDAEETQRALRRWADSLNAETMVSYRNNSPGGFSVRCREFSKSISALVERADGFAAVSTVADSGAGHKLAGSTVFAQARELAEARAAAPRRRKKAPNITQRSRERRGVRGGSEEEIRPGKKQIPHAGRNATRFGMTARVRPLADARSTRKARA